MSIIRHIHRYDGKVMYELCKQIVFYDNNIKYEYYDMNEPSIVQGVSSIN